MYRTLNLKYVVSTLQTMGNRIRARFPESNLNRICHELLEIAAECESRVQGLRRPHWLLRCGVVGVILVFFVVTTAIVASLDVRLRVENIAELLQGLDAGVNEIILVALALYFLFSLEKRLKQRDALDALHELRCIAHVIDMHQLTKDPEVTLRPDLATPASPQRSLTRFQLSRYLDYCAELLALTSKLAAYHAQYLKDPVILEAVNDVETLTGGLTQKIWQKISILDINSVPPEPSGSPDLSS
jgi:hypothetical protein